MVAQNLALREAFRGGRRHRRDRDPRQGGEYSRIARCEASHSPPTLIIDRFSGPSLGRALGRGGHRPSLLFSFNHPHDPLLRQVAAWIAYPPDLQETRANKPLMINCLPATS